MAPRSQNFRGKLKILGAFYHLVANFSNPGSPEFIEEECRYLNEIFKKLGYCKLFIDNSHRVARKRFYSGRELRREEEWKNVLVFPGELNEATRSIIPKEVKIVSRSVNTIGKLVKTPNNVLKREDTGVYVIGCDGCEEVYVGESDDFKRRRYQHSRSIMLLDENSSLVKHNETNGHNINLDKSEMIYNTSHVPTRRGLESYVIKNE